MGNRDYYESRSTDRNVGRNGVNRREETPPVSNSTVLVGQTTVSSNISPSIVGTDKAASSVSSGNLKIKIYIAYVAMAVGVVLCF